MQRFLPGQIPEGFWGPGKGGGLGEGYIQNATTEISLF